MAAACHETKNSQYVSKFVLDAGVTGRGLPGGTSVNEPGSARPAWAKNFMLKCICVRQCVK